MIKRSDTMHRANDDFMHIRPMTLSIVYSEGDDGLLEKIQGIVVDMALRPGDPDEVVGYVVYRDGELVTVDRSHVAGEVVLEWAPEIPEELRKLLNG